MIEVTISLNALFSAEIKVKLPCKPNIGETIYLGDLDNPLSVMYCKVEEVIYEINADGSCNINITVKPISE